MAPDPPVNASPLPRGAHGVRSTAFWALVVVVRAGVIHLGAVGIWKPLRPGVGRPAWLAYQKKTKPISSGMLMSAIPIPIHPRIRPAVARSAL